MIRTSQLVGGSLLLTAFTGSDRDEAAPTSEAARPEATSGSTEVASTPWAGADFGELDVFLANTAGESFVIVEGGRRIHEWYRTDASYTQDVASAQKSVIDRRIPGVGDDWFVASFTPTPLNHGYGYLWWLNGQDTFCLPRLERTEQTGLLIPTAPIDAVATLGKDDQKFYLSDELGLVVARQGGRADAQSRAALSGFDDDLWAMLLRLRGDG